jgi:hypothetical protein
VSQDDLKLSQGQESVVTYEESASGKKLFCLKCGSPIYNVNKKYPGLLMVHYGSLSKHSDMVPTFNIYCESKLSWVDTVSNIKSFAKSIER